MKVLSLLPLVYYFVVVTADFPTITPPNDANNNPLHMTRATFMGEPRIEYCPTDGFESGIEQTFGINAWTDVVKSKIGGVDVSTSSFTRIINQHNGISFKLTATVFHAAGTTINAEGQVVSVPKGGLKFTVEFNKWPITDVGNADDQLQLSLQVDTSSGVPGSYSLVEITGVDNMKTIVFGTDTNTAGSYMDIPTLALLDGAMAPVTATFQSGTLKLVFPMFTTKLVYDPVLSSNNVNAQIPPIVALTTPKDANNNAIVNTAVNFWAGRVRQMVFCPSGDCVNGQVVKAVLGRLGSYNAAGDSKGFLGISTAVAWTDIVKSKEGTVDVSTTTITTDFGNSKTMKVTAMVFHADGTTMSGKAQTVNVPAGALKFSLELPGRLTREKRPTR